MFTQLLKSLAASLLIMSAYSHAADSALIVGVGNYADPSANLPGIDKDTAMAKEMALSLGISEKNILELSDAQANVANVKSALQRLANQTNRSDRVFIYVSSHGSNTADTNGDEKDGLDETLYLYDGHFLDDDFGKLLSQFNTERTIVVLDACNSGTGTKSLALNRLGVSQSKIKSYKSIPNKSLNRDFAIESDSNTAGRVKHLALAAAQDDQYAQATEKGSMFTISLYQALNASKASGKRITWKNLFELTKSNLANLTNSFYPNLDGNMSIASKQVKFANASSASGQPMLETSEHLVSTANTKLAINAPSSLYEGDELDFSITAPFAGYLNVLSVGPTGNTTILYPNKFHENNWVEKGKVQLPGGSKFMIRAQKPLGDTKIVAFLTKQNTNLRKSGVGDLKSTSRDFNVFARTNSHDLSESMQNVQKAAGSVTINIK